MNLIAESAKRILAITKEVARGDIVKIKGLVQKDLFITAEGLWRLIFF